MLKNIVTLLVLVSSFASSFCQSNDITLGALVEQSYTLLNTEVNEVALLDLQQPIKVSITQHSFTKKTFKAFKSQNNPKVNINYVDSLEAKPSYLRISIADKTGLLKAINQKNNEAVKTLVKTNSKIKLVSSLHIAFNKTELNALLHAEEVFLEAYGVNSYALGAYTKGEKTATIPFTKGSVFDIDTSNFCWQELKGKLQIVDITARKRCHKGTYKSADKVKTKVNYYKF